jgi:Ca2+-binding EF-hand superfamily protein
MRKGTKIALAASALVLAGAAGLSTMAIAEYRGSHGGGHHMAAYGGHGHHGGWHGKRWRSGRHMDRLMERFDTDNDGKLTQEELDEARKTLLAKHDADKDGKLSLAEFEKLWIEVMHKRIVRGFQRIDADGDAAITTEEFLEPFSKVVERFDRNEDGALDKEDRRYRHDRGDGDGDRRHGPKGGMGPRG